MVTKSVPAGMIAAGMPARVIKPRQMNWDPKLMALPERDV